MKKSIKGIAVTLLALIFGSIVIFTNSQASDLHEVREFYKENMAIKVRQSSTLGDCNFYDLTKEEQTEYYYKNILRYLDIILKERTKYTHDNEITKLDKLAINNSHYYSFWCDEDMDRNYEGMYSMSKLSFLIAQRVLDGQYD